MPQILQLANASAGAMYSYFESKRELADEVFRIAHLSFDEQVWHAFPSHLPLRGQLRELCQRYASFISAQPHYAALVMLISEDPLHHTSHDALRALISSWHRTSEVAAPSPHGLFVLIQGAFVQLTHQSFIAHTPPPHELFLELEHYIWHAMTASPQGIFETP